MKTYLPIIRKARLTPLATAVRASWLGVDEYAHTCAMHYPRIVPENEGKYWYVHDHGWGAMDKIAQWADEYSKSLHYHCLRWSCGLQPTDIEGWITEAMTRYPRIQAWDVVNEGYNSEGVACLPMIEDSYRIARKVNPTATLYYNGMLFGPGEQAAVKRLVIDGLCDGVGIQMHNQSGYDLELYRPLVEWLYVNDIPWRVSEFEFLIGAYTPDWLTIQANAYRDAVQFSTAYGASEFCTWGFTDLVSWEADNYPLPFDKNYQPKPAWKILIGDN